MQAINQSKPTALASFYLHTKRCEWCRETAVSHIDFSSRVLRIIEYLRNVFLAIKIWWTNGLEKKFSNLSKPWNQVLFQRNRIRCITAVLRVCVNVDCITDGQARHHRKFFKLQFRDIGLKVNTRPTLCFSSIGCLVIDEPEVRYCWPAE